jgi:hypothetical protein
MDKCLTGNHFETKIWYSLPCKAKTAGSAHVTMLLPLGGFTLVKLQPLDIK